VARRAGARGRNDGGGGRRSLMDMPPGPDALPPEYRLDRAADPWRDWRQTAALVRRLTQRHLAQRYRGSALGFLWSFLNPLLMMAVYAFVFRFVFRETTGDVPYLAFFLTGYLAWSFFSVAARNAAASVIEGATLIQKAYFPRLALPLSAVLSSAVNYLVSLPILLAFNAAFGVWPGGALLLLLPAALGLLFVLALGVGLILASLAPFFRDVLQLVEVLFTAWFFATPIFYDLSMVTAQSQASPWAVALYRCNPLVGASVFVRTVFLGTPSAPGDLAVSAVAAAALLAAGLALFARFSPRFAEAV
jgi:ABC-2 type transport system permease protein